MLCRLRISNYALIEHLEIELKSGFTSITGETGAGKSILLGALGLVLGNRADTGVLHDKENKCFVEATFNLSKLDLKSFFIQNELEYDPECILRREISNTGKSRAFINDSPVNLVTLKDLGELLVDIHSQHDSLHLTDSAFQLDILDGLANNDSILKEYIAVYQQYQQCKKDLAALKTKSANALAELDLFSFQYTELEKANLKSDELEELEQRLTTLSHAEEIRSNLFNVTELLNRSEINILGLLHDVNTSISRLKKFLPEAISLSDRIQSTIIEIKDIAQETENQEQNCLFDPAELEKINSRIFQLRHLLTKYGFNNTELLIGFKDELKTKIDGIDKMDFNINSLSKTLHQLERKLSEKSQALTFSRRKVIPEIERSISLLLTQLGMPNAKFKASMLSLTEHTSTGIDSLQFLFTANKGTQPEDISKVASGGELSRVMLAIKSLMSGKKMIPTIIFDEIDTGVSGEIAAKVGRIMASMAHKMQLIAITHLPQIAGKANQHLLVFKRDDNLRSKTMMIQLNEIQRVDEIARMLSDDRITEASRNAAKELISGF